MALLRLIRSLGRLRGDRRGNFATIFALTLMPLLGFAGVATDFAKSTLVKRRLDLAIDSASLAALNKTVTLINGGKTTDTAAIAAGEADGRAYLAAQAASVIDGSLTTPTITVTRSGATLTATATYDATVPTVFARLFGKDNYRVDGRSVATVTLPPFFDVHVLVDVSESMGIGATKADQDILYNMKVKYYGNDVQAGCTFGCHIIQEGYTESTYTSGRRAGATMRIDVIRNALQKFAQSLLTNTTKRYRLAIYTMHSRTATLVPLTDDLATVTAGIASGVQLASAYGGTNFHVALKQLTSTIKTPGDGSTQASAQSALIFMTDGVEDTQMEQPGSSAITWDPNFVYYNPTAGDWGGTIQSIDPGLCAPFKSRGVRVIAMNTKYIVPDKPWNPKFDAVRDWLYVYINGNMQKCVSSPSDYYDASSPSDIDKATSDILNSISKPIALTQ